MSDNFKLDYSDIEQPSTSGKKKRLDLTNVRINREPPEKMELPVGKIIVCSEDRPSVLVRTLFDPVSGAFQTIEQERGKSWSSIGVTLGQQSKIRTAISELHKSANFDPIFIDNNLVRLEYAQYLYDYVEVDIPHAEEFEKIRFLFAVDQGILIRIKTLGWISWKAIGIMDKGDDIKKVLRRRFETECKKIDFNRVQTSFDLSPYF